MTAIGPDHAMSRFNRRQSPGANGCREVREILKGLEHLPLDFHVVFEEAHGVEPLAQRDELARIRCLRRCAPRLSPFRQPSIFPWRAAPLEPSQQIHPPAFAKPGVRIASAGQARLRKTWCSHCFGGASPPSQNLVFALLRRGKPRLQNRMSALLPAGQARLRKTACPHCSGGASLAFACCRPRSCAGQVG
jgi:hypothetical protein